MPANIWAGSNGSPITTYNIDSDRRDLYVAPVIKRLVPEATPFLHILNEIGVESITSPEWTWYDDEPGAWWTKVNDAVGITDVATTITVDDSSPFKPKDLIKVPSTNEVMYVVSVDSATQITVKRGYGREVIGGSPVGGTAAAAIADDANLLRIGNALAENDDPAESRGSQPEKQYNYIQNFSDTCEGSEDDDNEAKKTNQTERQRLRQDKMLKQRLDIARGILLGERREIVADKTRLTGGLLQFIKTNSRDVGSTNAGILTESEFELFCEMLFTYGSKNKLFMCSPRVGSIINQFAVGKIETRSGEDTYGIRMSTYKSFHGDLKIATSQVFERDYATMGIGIDLGEVKMKSYGGNWMQLRQNIQSPGKHGWKDELYTQCGLEVRLEKSHAILTGVTG